MGENFVVIGLGLIGLLAVQLLRAHGCRVLGVDFDSAKCALAQRFGAETVDLSQGGDPLAAARAFTGGRGVDGVLITASTKSSEPVAQAAQMSRKRGRIVQVGATGLELNRADFYEKELSFQVSCSYGPGRYDPEYEDKGRDYPLGFVRWTEQRNFEAVLGQFAAGTVQVEPLISHRFDFDRALDAYASLSAPGAMGMVLTYSNAPASFQEPAARTLRHIQSVVGAPAAPVLGVLGAGNFTARTLLPALAACGVAARRKAIVSGGGLTAAQAARKFGFELSTTDSAAVLGDAEINTVFVTTRHHAHARQALAALAAGKHVFVEKPLCLNLEELAELEAAAAHARTLLMIGFNRRFSPHIEKMQALLDGTNSPRAMIYTVNAGAIPATLWPQDPAVGGGRIIGEGCHFIDLLRFLANAPIVSARADFLEGADGALGDVASLHLRFGDGSIGTVHYLANGNAKVPKERLEVFCAGKILQLDNFRVLTGLGWKNFGTFKTSSPDKGHARELARFLEAIRSGGPSPIPAAEIFEVSRAAIELAKQGRATAGV